MWNGVRAMAAPVNTTTQHLEECEMKSGILRKGMGGVLATCLLGAATVSVAWAHHAASNFDMTKKFIFKGTVRKWLWENPHAWLYMEVPKADGSTEVWGFESGGPNTLARLGMHANTLKPGDKISVYAVPDRTGVHNAMLKKIVMPDGREWSMFRAPAPRLPAGSGAGGPGGPEAGEGLPPPFPSVPAVEYK